MAKDKDLKNEQDIDKTDDQAVDSRTNQETKDDVDEVPVLVLDRHERHHEEVQERDYRDEPAVQIYVPSDDRVCGFHGFHLHVCCTLGGLLVQLCHELGVAVGLFLQLGVVLRGGFALGLQLNA